MSSDRRAGKRRPADLVRVRKILVGPVYHDPLYKPFVDADGMHQSSVLMQRNPHKMPRNVAPLVCNIEK